MAKQTSKAGVQSDSPCLNKEKSECKAGDIILKIDQSIEYRKANEEKNSVGKIKSFMYAGYGQEEVSSIWMNIQDTFDKSNQSEYISVNIWLGHHKAGLFNNDTKPKSNESGNKKPKSNSKRPF